MKNDPIVDDDDDDDFVKQLQAMSPPWWSPSSIWYQWVRPFLRSTKDWVFGWWYPVRVPVPEGYCCPHPYCRAGSPLDDFLNVTPHYLPHKLNSIWFRRENDAILLKLTVAPDS